MTKTKIPTRYVVARVKVTHEGQPRRQVITYIPDLSYGIHATIADAKRAFVTRIYPEMATATDQFINIHFKAETKKNSWRDVIAARILKHTE